MMPTVETYIFFLLKDSFKLCVNLLSFKFTSIGLLKPTMDILYLLNIGKAILAQKQIFEIMVAEGQC